MKSDVFNPKHKQTVLCVTHIAFATLAVLITATRVAEAAPFRNEPAAVLQRPVGEPIIAIVSLRDQRVTVYDDRGWIMRASVERPERTRDAGRIASLGCSSEVVVGLC